MSTFNPHILSALTSRFTTSDALFAWLKTEDGGKLCVRDGGGGLALVYSVKGVSEYSHGHVREFRSVVWDTVTNLPVCVGPRSGQPLESDLSSECVLSVEEFVDGVMINMFYREDRWQLATHTVLGATNSYYGKRPFGALFWETFESMDLDVEELDKSATYSWVLQHPEERVVVAPKRPILYLVSHTSTELSEGLAATCPGHFLLEPKLDVYRMASSRMSKGIVVKTETESFTLRSPAYLKARDLRGNQPKHAFIWLERWSEGKLGAYLELFPEEKAECEAVVNQFKACTQEFHALYVKVYSRRELPLGQAPQKYRKLLWEARQANTGSYFGSLRDFMNNQDTARKLWLVHYETRYATRAAE